MPPISPEKSFTNLAASRRPFDETEYQARSGVPDTALRQFFQPICDHLLKLLLLLTRSADELANLLMQRFEQFLPLARRLIVNDARAIPHDCCDRPVERPAADVLFDVVTHSARDRK